MEEDWGRNANAPKFSLFKSKTPQQAALEDGHVDVVVYNRWKKADRRLYQRLKVEQIARRIAEEKLATIEDLSDALNSLTFIKKDAEPDPVLDQLIGQVQQLQIKSSVKK